MFTVKQIKDQYQILKELRKFIISILYRTKINSKSFSHHMKLFEKEKRINLRSLVEMNLEENFSISYEEYVSYPLMDLTTIVIDDTTSNLKCIRIGGDTILFPNRIVLDDGEFSYSVSEETYDIWPSDVVFLDDSEMANLIKNMMSENMIPRNINDLTDEDLLMIKMSY